MSVSFNQIPRDVQLLVFSYLKPEELGRYSRVCKIWYALANTESLWKSQPLPSIAFGKREWEKYLGDVGEEPPLPREVYKILKSPCPFWEGKRVEETHLLTLIPKTVNGQPLTLTSLQKLVMHPKQGQPTGYDMYPSTIKEEYGSTPLFRSTWVLLTKKIIPGSEGKDFEAQMQLLANSSQKAGMAYEVPKLLEAATSIFMEYLRNKMQLYSSTYTWCQETIYCKSWPSAIGNFCMKYLRVDMAYRNTLSLGLGGMRRF